MAHMKISIHVFNSSFLQYLTENNDFMVIGIIGPPGVGKSTIMNALYGYDGSSPGTVFIYLYGSFLRMLWFVLHPWAIIQSYIGCCGGLIDTSIISIQVHLLVDNIVI